MVLNVELLLARLCNTDGVERPAWWRHRQALDRHQFPKKQSCVGVPNRRLHTDSDQAVRVIDRLPGVNGKFPAPVVGISVIADVELRTVIGEDLNDLCAALVRCAV